jgi:hypothetical protein
VADPKSITWMRLCRSTCMIRPRIAGENIESENTCLDPSNQVVFVIFK